MTEQQEALRLAQALKDGAGLDSQWDAAKELCRLHEENERLKSHQPAAWVGLTDEEALTEAARHLGEMHIENCGLSDIKDFARAIEAKLKEKNHG